MTKKTCASPCKRGTDNVVDNLKYIVERADLVQKNGDEAVINV